jgi:hypothetical protein
MTKKYYSCGHSTLLAEYHTLSLVEKAMFRSWKYTDESDRCYKCWKINQQI